MDKLKEEIKLAVDIFKSGNLLKAEQVSKKLVKENPKIAFLYNLLGLISVSKKSEEEAKEWYEKGLKVDPSYAMIYNNLGLLYFDKKTEESCIKAEGYYKKSISLDKTISEPHTNLGSLYGWLNRNNDAIKCHQKAIEINPKSAGAYYNLSNVYLALGRFEEAIKNLRESVKINPKLYIAHRNLSRVLKYTQDEEHFDELKNIYKNIKKDEDDYKTNICFALGKAYEDIKDFDESFKFYNKANSSWRKIIKYSIESEIGKFSETKSTFDKNLFDKFSNVGYQNYSPIFIVGMPRSGTTLIEQILSSHEKVFGADEVDFIPELIRERFGKANQNLFFQGVMKFNKSEFKVIGEKYHNKMNERSNNYKIATDKLPINFMSIGFIKLILPNAKIVHCQRNPKDNILSIYKNHFPGGRINYGYNLSELVDYYNLYSDLMKYWNKILPNFIYNINYEKLTSNPETQIRDLLSFCKLDWQDDCLNFHNNKRPIKTASDTQARNKIYKTSINSWKNYEKHLEKYLFRLKV